jgi:ribonuclease R
MHILEPFKDKRVYSFLELLELGYWDYELLEKLLNEKVDNGILRRKKDNYSLERKFIIGRLDLKEGFGFLLLEGMEDLYLQDRDLGTALDGDLVLVRMGRYNHVIEILKRETEEVVCTVKKFKNQIFLTPNKYFRLPIRLVGRQNVLDGEVVLIKFVEYNLDYIDGRIEERIGFINDPDIDILTLVYEYGFPYKFPKEVINEANSLDREIKKDDRFVVTDEYIVTIDGEDAKDLDDAISLKIVDGNYHLSVHIADVSHYVKKGSSIDKEALKRATSAYLADRVIPMLPQRLSNDLCSLNEEEKYALSVFMIINDKGEVVSHEIKETVINVNRRLSYNEVNAYFAGGSLKNKQEENMLDNMLKLSKLLKEQREKEGSLEFESVEYKYILNENNDIVDIQVREHGISEGIIEQFMILTNQIVGSHLFYLDLPSIYRVHEKPKDEKLLELFTELKALDVNTPKHKNITPKTLQAIIRDVEDSPNKRLVHELMLKAMNRAKYTMEPLGHFGLALKYYSHFTAPIRRYPDLLLHRIVKDFLIRPNNLKKTISYYEENIEPIAIQSSKMERLAMTLEREVDKLKIAEFMEDKVGNIYEGIVSGVTKNQIFVEIDKGIEGAVLVRTLEDYYNYDEKRRMLVGEKTNEVFKLGKKLIVKLVSVSVELRQITFEIVGK